MLVRHVLGIDRAQLLSHPEHTLTPHHQRDLEALVQRRLQREPLPYILGAREFYGLDFIVTPAVMVPRPETESLVEHALGWAQARVHLTIADIGAGSGCIAVSLAVNLPGVAIIAVDISAAALEVARRNIRRHGVQRRVRLVEGDLAGPLLESVDMLVANLPYVRDDEIPSLQPEVRDYEPKEALKGGLDGTTLITALLKQAPSRLKPGGVVMLEMDPRQRNALEQDAVQVFPKAAVRVVKDLAGRDRVLVVQS